MTDYCVQRELEDDYYIIRADMRRYSTVHQLVHLQQQIYDLQRRVDNSREYRKLGRICGPKPIVTGKCTYVQQDPTEYVWKTMPVVYTPPPPSKKDERNIDDTTDNREDKKKKRSVLSRLFFCS